VHLAIYDAENAENAVDFLKAVKAVFPFRITHIVTDRGSCFTADAFEKACCDMTIDRRRMKAYSPQTNGMVEHFNGRVAAAVLQVCVASHEDLEILLKGLCFAYNQRKQRVLAGLSSAEHIASWLKKTSRISQCGSCETGPPRFYETSRSNHRICKGRLTTCQSYSRSPLVPWPAEARTQASSGNVLMMSRASPAHITSGRQEWNQ